MTNQEKKEILELLWDAYNRSADESYYTTAGVLSEAAELFENDELTVKGLAFYIVRNCPQL